MRVLFTGATGVIGRRAVPRLVDEGHEVLGVGRDEAGHEWLESVGARALTLDLFDRAAVKDAVAGSSAVVHMATSIPPQVEMRKRAAWAMNDRLRAEATAHLVDASIDHDVEAFVQQSITLPYADGGDAWLDEDAPIAVIWDVHDSMLRAERHVERFARTGGRGVTLRLSWLYGPGRVSEEYVASIRARKLPIIGPGDNYVSHLHIDDAGAAVAAALSAPAGTYNVSEDEPVTRRQELETVAAALGAKPPRQVPLWLARLLAGRPADMLALSHRVSNRRFREATGWAPEHVSIVEGRGDLARAG